MRNKTFDPIQRRALLLDIARPAYEDFSERHLEAGGKPEELILEEARVEGVVDRYDVILYYYKRRLRYKPEDRVYYDKIAPLTARAVMDVQPFRSEIPKVSTFWAARANEYLALRTFLSFLSVDPEKIAADTVQHLFFSLQHLAAGKNPAIDIFVTLAVDLRNAYGSGRRPTFAD